MRRMKPTTSRKPKKPPAFPVGALVRPHLHTEEDEYSIVTEGEIDSLG